MRNKNISDWALPLFVIWPFGAFLASLTDLRRNTSGLVFVLFCTVYGFSFSFENTSADSYRMAYVFQMFEFNSLKGIYLVYREGGSTDLYRYLIYGLTKIFTNNPKVLYGFFGFVFGLFLYLSLRLMVIEKGEKNNFYFFLIILFFFSLYPIPSMNGARFNTAAWVFFFSTMNFLFLEKKKWMFGVLATPLIHFSFLFIVGFIFLFYFFGNLFYSKTNVKKWLFYCYIICFGLYWILGTNVFNVGFLSNSDIFSSSISSKIDIYTSDKTAEIVESRNQTSSFLIVSRIFAYAMQIYFFSFLLRVKKVISLTGSYKNMHKMLAFIFFFLSISFLVSTIPSGGRFITIGYLFTLFLFIRIYKILPNYFSNQVLWGLPVFSFFIAYSIIYLGISLVNPSLWYGNLIWIVYDALSFTKELVI